MAQSTTLSPTLLQQPPNRSASFFWLFPFCQNLKTAARVILFRKSKADPVSTVLELPSGFPSLSEQSQSFHKGQLSPAGPVPLCASLTYHLLFNVLTGFSQSELLTVLPLSWACWCIFLFAIPLLGLPFPGVCMAHSHIFNQMSLSQWGFLWPFSFNMLLWSLKWEYILLNLFLFYLFPCTEM